MSTEFINLSLVLKSKNIYEKKTILNVLDGMARQIHEINLLNGLTLRYQNIDRNLTRGLVSSSTTQTLIPGKRIINGVENIALPPKSLPAHISSDETLTVDQGECLFASVKDTRFLATYGLCPCVCLTIYDVDNKEGILVHLDDAGKAEDVNSVLDLLQREGRFSGKNLEAHVIGGAEGLTDPKTYKVLENILLSRNIKIVESNLGRHPSRGDAVLLDLETGEVINHNAFFKGTLLSQLIPRNRLLDYSCHSSNKALRFGKVSSHTIELISLLKLNNTSNRTARC